MTDLIQKGKDVIKEAVDLDNEEKYEEAIQMYRKGLDYLVAGTKYERNKKAKAILNTKINEYLTRAEELQKAVEAKRSHETKRRTVRTGARGGHGEDSKDGDGKNADGDDEETAKLKGALAGAIVTEKPNVRWEDVAGLETAKSLLKEAVLLPLKFPQLFVGKRKPWKGILLYGPPGTGKSFLAKAVATEAGASTFFSVSSSDLVSKFQGESERLVRNLFELARAKSPAIIFIDEIDSLCGNRSDGENDSARRIKTEFLVQMQGVGKTNDGILVLGATNTPWDLDPAIRRRFEKRVYIPLPEAIARKVMFHLNIGSTPCALTEEDFDVLAENTDGFSGSDISVVVRDALMEPVRRMQQATHFRRIPNPEGTDPPEVYAPCSPDEPDAEEMSLMEMDSRMLSTPMITFEDFENVLETAKPSVSEQDIVRQEEWTKEFGQEGR